MCDYVLAYDVFSRHSAVWNLLWCLDGDEVISVCLSRKIQQTLHFLNQQSHTLPAAALCNLLKMETRNPTHCKMSDLEKLSLD